MQKAIKIFDNLAITDRIKIILLGDIHIGNIGCEEEKVKKHIDYIRYSPNTYWLDMGDKVEAITRLDKRWDSNCFPDWIKLKDVDDLPRVQADRYIELMKPIAHKCLGLIEGNHENAVRRAYSQDIHNYICLKLGVQDLGFLSFYRLLFRRKKYTTSVHIDMCLSHGVGGGRYIGGKINKLSAMSSDFVADIYAVGHHHDKVIYKKKQIAFNQSGEIVEKSKILIAVPSFFQTYVEGTTTYAERALYPPTSTGVIKLTIQPFIRQFVDGKNSKCRTWKLLSPDIHISE